MSIETKEKYNSMKQGTESHCVTIVHIKVKDTDLAVLCVSSDINVDTNPPAVDSGGAGCHADDYYIHPNVAAFGIWARVIYRDTASVENPPNVKYFVLLPTITRILSVRTIAGNVEDIDLFITWHCENNQGNYLSFHDTMIEQELYPDDMVPDPLTKD
ncbi:hypothetical protein BS47DRAFT_1360444 [Hydnum rufescens UP504]|uniref:Uncharacterized protein n=1 Tax=Hydnum rufescens UP504 TaxID=1448309 RepID=A0A9P6B4N7_9AGAM|nr:hypothetical protein BS47DRAFT_1360444 [Hydnum rufescens UP504]